MILDRLIKRMPGERMVAFLRRHPIILVGDTLMVAFMAAVPAGIWFAIGYFWPLIPTHYIGRPLLILLGSFYYICLWQFAMTTFVDYYLDGWIITDRRILSVEQQGLFSRTVSELDLSRVQDVTSEEKGILAFIFGYGNVYIQTAGETTRFDFHQVPHPEDIRKRILGLVETEQKREAMDRAAV